MSLQVDAQAAAAAAATASARSAASAWPAGIEQQPDAAFYAAWLARVCAALPGAQAGVVVVGPPELGPFAPQAFWPQAEGGAPQLADVAEQALGSRAPVAAELPAPAPAGAPAVHASAVGLALPLLVDHQLHGVVAVALAQPLARPAAELLDALRWDAAWITLHLRRTVEQEDSGQAQRLMLALDQVAALLQDQPFDEAARGFVTELATQLGCDRVSLGRRRGSRVRPLALSHSADLARRTSLVQALGEAMDEAFDQKAVIRLPAQPGDEVLVTRAHALLADGGCVLSIPFQGADGFAGVLCFERTASQPFGAAELALGQSLAAMAGRVLALKHRSERPLPMQVLLAARRQLQRLFGPRHITRKLVVLGLVAAVAFFSVATVPYRVGAPATLQGELRRTVAAPFDGFVTQASVRAGDVVKAGAVLAVLDDRDLRLERLKWAAQYAQYQKQQQEAVAGRDRAKAQISQAQFEQALAQVNLIDEQLGRAVVRAPFAGVIVRGDLSQTLGSAVRRGDVLFELTPLAGYRVVVEVDERDIQEIAVGQKGQLLLAAIADQPLPFTITRLTSVTTARDGRNCFRIEGVLAAPGERLRPGMEGVGKVEVGERRLIWVWTHRLVDWLRLFAWTWLP